MSKLNKKYITGTTTWTAPAGVTGVIVIGCGGGGGGGGGGGTGGGGTAGQAGSGGAGAFQTTTYLSVTPNTVYTITIGAGGTHGNAHATGSAGSDTTFGSLATFKGASGGQQDTASSSFGGSSFQTASGTNVQLSNATTSARSIANGGNGIAASPGLSGDMNIVGGFSGGTGGNNPGAARGGGGGGGAGPQGAGANGGDGAGVGAGTGVAGSSASANTGGGGGGGGASSTGTGGAGGDGGSGYIYIIWQD